MIISCSIRLITKYYTNCFVFLHLFNEGNIVSFKCQGFVLFGLLCVKNDSKLRKMKGRENNLLELHFSFI